MTSGALIFSQNTATVDYNKLAVFAAERVKNYLEIPVSIVTDNTKLFLDSFPDHPFDQVIEIPSARQEYQKKFYDGSLSSKMLDWKNLSRSQVYNLTPYDKTLVIDSDYILGSSMLKSAFENDHDFQIYSKSMDITDWRPTAEFNRINPYSVPFYWATAFVFQKNEIMQSFFDLITYIKTNWIYFRTLYSIPNPLFRNDFAFSIAIHIMNGKTNGQFAVELPGKMFYAMDRDILVSIDNNKMKFLIEKKDFLGEYIAAKTTGLDVHVINKLSLSRYIDGGSGV
jgi:alpha-N-acetylglucosamine transferase